MSVAARVVITGGAGFIGSHVVERFLGEGHHVLVVDNCSTGRLENLTHVRRDPRLAVEVADVTDAEAMSRLVGRDDWIIHLAALADIVPSIQRPLDYFHANVTGTTVMLETARQAGAARFVYAASSSCYGIPDVYPTPETAAIRPQYPYAAAKYLAEQVLFHWGQVYRLPAVSLRLFNVYGPRSRTSGAYGAVFGVFLAQKLAGKPMTVVGSGAQTRDFVFVSDVAEAVLGAARSTLHGEALNVGSGAPQSINRLVELLGGSVVHLPKRPGEPDCTWAAIGKIRQALGWEPRTPFERGVRIMLEAIHHWDGAPVWTPETIAEATKEWFACLT